MTAEHGFITAADLLLSCGASINAVDMVARLLVLNMTISRCWQQNRWTPLHLAARSGEKHMVSWLLQHQADHTLLDKV